MWKTTLYKRRWNKEIIRFSPKKVFVSYGSKCFWNFNFFWIFWNLIFFILNYNYLSFTMSKIIHYILAFTITCSNHWVSIINILDHIHCQISWKLKESLKFYFKDFFKICSLNFQERFFKYLKTFEINCLWPKLKKKKL